MMERNSNPAPVFCQHPGYVQVYFKNTTVDTRPYEKLCKKHIAVNNFLDIFFSEIVLGYLKLLLDPLLPLSTSTK